MIELLQVRIYSILFLLIFSIFHDEKENSFQLSEIAQEARKLAEQQENRSIEIEALAEKIANTSKQALVEAKEVIFGGKIEINVNLLHMIILI